MENSEIIKSLRDISNMRSASNFKRTICKAAAQRLEQLSADLAQVKAERAAAIADLTESGPCFACKNFRRNGGNCIGGEICLEEMLKCEISAQEYTGPEWEWRGINTRTEAESALKGGDG